MKRRRRYGTGSLFKKGRTWWLQYMVKGERECENSGTSDRAAAEQILKTRVAEVALQMVTAPDGDLTIARICQLVIQDYQIRKLRDEEHMVWRYEKNVAPKLGKILAQRATRQHFIQYIDERRREGASDGTINRELAIVKRAYNLALREDPPLLRKAPFIPKLREENVRQGFLEPYQYARLLEELPDQLKALFVCAYHVGTRKGELGRLRWDQVDLDNNLIRLPGVQTKTKKPRTLPIYGDMQFWLRKQFEKRPAGSPWVFYGQCQGTVWRNLNGWREACERAGMPDLIFHDLRRSAVRNMKRAGLQDGEAMAISGHRTRAVFDRYNIIDEASMGSVARRLGEYAQEQQQLTRARLELVK